MEHYNSIENIVLEELGCESFSVSRISKNKYLIEVSGHNINVSGDVTPKEFREEFAETLLFSIEKIIKRKQKNLEKAEFELKHYLEIYNHYYKYVDKIMNEQIDTLSPISHKSHLRELL